jgi:hypothetical protein
VATARPVLMPLRLHEFADFANYQLPEIGSPVIIGPFEHRAVVVRRQLDEPR